MGQKLLQLLPLLLLLLLLREPLLACQCLLLFALFFALWLLPAARGEPCLLCFSLLFLLSNDSKRLEEFIYGTLVARRVKVAAGVGATPSVLC